MPVIYSPKRKQYYTGEGWSQENTDAKIYPTDEAAHKAAKGFGMIDVELQPDPTGEENVTASSSVHETGHGSGDQ